MTVRELIERLGACMDQDATVVLSHDAEGNGYSPLAAICEGAFGRRNGFLWEPELADEDDKPAVCLWPV